MNTEDKRLWLETHGTIKFNAILVNEPLMGRWTSPAGITFSAMGNNGDDIMSEIFDDVKNNLFNLADNTVPKYEPS